MTTSPTQGEHAQPVLASLLNIILNHEARATPDEVRRMAHELVAARAALAAAQPASPVAQAEFLRSVIALCTRKGPSPANIEAWDSSEKWIADLWRQAEKMLASEHIPAVVLENGAESNMTGGAVLPAWWPKFIQGVCEITDRSSPEDEPDAIVATPDELAVCALNAIEGASHGQAPAGAAVGIVRWAAGIEGSQLEVRWKDGEAPPAGTQVYAQTTTAQAAQAAPAAGAVAGPSEIMEKINTLIASINEAHHAKDPGWKQGCFDAADSVYEQIKVMLAAPTPAAQADSVLEDAARWKWVAAHWKTVNFRFDKRSGMLAGFTLTVDATKTGDGAAAIEREIDATRKQGGTHDNH